MKIFIPLNFILLYIVLHFCRNLSLKTWMQVLQISGKTLVCNCRDARYISTWITITIYTLKQLQNHSFSQMLYLHIYCMWCLWITELICTVTTLIIPEENQIHVLLFYRQPCQPLGYSVLFIEEGFIQKTRKRSALLFGGQNLSNTLPCYCCFLPGLFE